MTDFRNGISFPSLIGRSQTSRGFVMVTGPKGMFPSLIGRSQTNNNSVATITRAEVSIPYRKVSNPLCRSHILTPSQGFHPLQEGLKPTVISQMLYATSQRFHPLQEGLKLETDVFRRMGLMSFHPLQEGLKRGTALHRGLARAEFPSLIGRSQTKRIQNELSSKTRVSIPYRKVSNNPKIRDAIQKGMEFPSLIGRSQTLFWLGLFSTISIISIPYRKVSNGYLSHYTYGSDQFPSLIGRSQTNFILPNIFLLEKFPSLIGRSQTL